uniref:Neur_chan_memb domain-containing protein n=1 Tax=Meloidogyne hapla TaxID=6305 RepID=A0A1I8BRV4_MELHA
MFETATDRLLCVLTPSIPVTGQLSDTCTPVQLIYNYNLVMCVLCIISYVIIGAIVLKKGE